MEQKLHFFQYGGNSHKFTVTIDYKTVTLTAETGKMSGSGIGYTTTVPYKSGYYKFEFIKEYKIITKKYDIYKYNEYLYSVYVHDAGYALSHRWVRV